MATFIPSAYCAPIPSGNGNWAKWYVLGSSPCEKPGCLLFQYPFTNAGEGRSRIDAFGHSYGKSTIAGVRTLCESSAYFQDYVNFGVITGGAGAGTLSVLIDVWGAYRSGLWSSSTTITVYGDATRASTPGVAGFNTYSNFNYPTGTVGSNLWLGTPANFGTPNPALCVAPTTQILSVTLYDDGTVA